MRRAAAALLLAATACTPGAGGSGEGDEPLPPVAIADCPGPADLLPEPTGDLPDLTLDCLGNGPAVELRRLGGVPTVLNLWASWCAPCKQEMPAFQRVSFAAKGRVRFLGVATSDNPRGSRLAIQATGIAYPSLDDPKGRLRAALGAVGMPTTVLVGADGKVKATLVGAKDEAEIRQEIRDELGVSI